MRPSVLMSLLLSFALAGALGGYVAGLASAHRATASLEEIPNLRGRQIVVVGHDPFLSREVESSVDGDTLIVRCRDASYARRRGYDAFEAARGVTRP